MAYSTYSNYLLYILLILWQHAVTTRSCGWELLLLLHYTLEMKPMQVMQWFIAIKSLLVGHKVSLSKKKAVLGVILCIMQPYRRVSLIRKPKNDF